MCMPGLAEKVGQLVEDAVHGGAKVAPSPLSCPNVQICCGLDEGPTDCQAWQSQLASWWRTPSMGALRLRLPCECPEPDALQNGCQID